MKEKKVVRIEVSPPSPESLAMEIVLDNYGHFCLPGKVREEDGKFIVPIIAEAPVKRKRIVTEYEPLGEVATIEIQKDPLKVISYPTTEEFLQILTDKLREKLGHENSTQHQHQDWPQDPELEGKD